jgi:Na+-driven multidrug efflux pump
MIDNLKKIRRFNDVKLYIQYIIEPYPWRFMGFIILTMLIPKIYELTNTFWIGQMDDTALAITEQSEFLIIFTELINETAPFGILALISQNYKNKERVVAILKNGIVLQILFSTFVMFLMILFTSQFISIIGTPHEIVSLTKQYLILKSIALPFDSVAFLILIFIKSIKKGKDALYLILCSVIVNMSLDLLLVSNIGFSLHLGINGVALGYIISKIVLMMLSVAYICHTFQIKLLDIIIGNNFHYIKPIIKIGGFAGIGSLVMNFGYMLTLIILNLIGTDSFGGYGLSMMLMWTAIIPVLALAEGTNVTVGTLFGEKRYADIDRIMQTSLVLTLGTMIIIGIGGGLFWNKLSAMLSINPAIVNYSTQTFWWLIVPYTFFAVSMVIKCLFIGTGQTKYILLTSLFANLIVVLPFVVLVMKNVIEVTFTSVMVQLFAVFVVELIIVVTFAQNLRKNNYHSESVQFSLYRKVGDVSGLLKNARKLSFGQSYKKAVNA